MTSTPHYDSYQGIPSMNRTKVHDYLQFLGRSWTRKGIALELGCWLGGTAAPLLAGLVEADYDRPFMCYDRWKADASEVLKAQEAGVVLHLGQDLLPVFLDNVQPIYSNIQPFKGRIFNLLDSYPGTPIEICIFDAPKKNPTFEMAIRKLSPHWIAGTTVLGLLDYYFHLSHPNDPGYQEPVKFIERNASCFRKIVDWPGECEGAFFQYLGGLCLP